MAFRWDNLGINSPSPDTTLRRCYQLLHNTPLYILFQGFVQSTGVLHPRIRCRPLDAYEYE